MSIDKTLSQCVKAITAVKYREYNFKRKVDGVEFILNNDDVGNLHEVLYLLNEQFRAGCNDEVLSFLDDHSTEKDEFIRQKDLERAAEKKAAASAYKERCHAKLREEVRRELESELESERVSELRSQIEYLKSKISDKQTEPTKIRIAVRRRNITPANNSDDESDDESDESDDESDDQSLDSQIVKKESILSNSKKKLEDMISERDILNKRICSEEAIIASIINDLSSLHPKRYTS